MEDNINELKQAEQPQTPNQRGRRQRDSNWIIGGVMVLLGVLFLIGNYTSFELQNWWALFILIPALGSLGSAWNAYRADGHLSQRVRSSLTWGMVVLAVALVFLLNLDWGVIWPIFLIIIGLGSLLAFFARQEGS